MIQHLKYNEIDFKKYDDCIDTSNNTRIYAYSYYLDSIKLSISSVLSLN